MGLLEINTRFVQLSEFKLVNDAKGLIKFLNVTSNISQIISNRTDNTVSDTIDDSVYHSKLLYLLVIIMLAFWVMGYYLYSTSKQNLKHSNAILPCSSAVQAKFMNIYRLAQANFCIFC
jgi:hypothetical protein